MSDDKKELQSGEESKSTNSVFTLVRQSNGIAHVVMDVVEDSMNTLKAEFAEQVSEVLAEIKADTSITGVVLLSGKKDSFVAGADINMINDLKTKEEVVSLSRQGQMIFAQLEQLNVPVVAAINGACAGLGLSIAQRISQILNHTISIESVLGRGSQFSLTVPLILNQPVEVKPVEAPAPSLSLPIAGLKILCIDNDADILDGMTALLERWSCKPYCAISLQDALMHIEQNDLKPDVVLVDYNLGRQCDNGLLVLQTLQQQLGTTPGVLITADASDAVMRKTEELGFAYLRKPVKPVRLRKLLMKLTR